MEDTKTEKTFFDWVLDATAVISGVIIILVMLMGGYEVISRKVFGRPTTWSLDLQTLGVLVSALLPIAWVLRHKGHVAMEFLTSRFSRRRQSLINMTVYSLALLGVGVAFWQSLDLFIDAYVENQLLFRGLVIPKIYYIWVFSLCFLLIIFEILRELHQFYKEFRKN